MFKSTTEQAMLLLDTYRRINFIPIYSYAQEDILRLDMLALITAVGTRQNEKVYAITPRGKKVICRMLNIDL